MVGRTTSGWYKIFLHSPNRATSVLRFGKQKIPEEEKLLWIQQEIGSDANLTEFAKYFLFIFADCIRDDQKLKQKINELYCTYKKLPKRKLEKIPNRDKGPFHRLWNKDAPDYCDCGKKISANARYCQKCQPPDPFFGKRKFEISAPRDDDDDLTTELRRIGMQMNKVSDIDPFQKRKKHRCLMPFL